MESVAVTPERGESGLQRGHHRGSEWWSDSGSLCRNTDRMWRTRERKQCRLTPCSGGLNTWKDGVDIK